MTSKVREIIQLKGNVRPDPIQGLPGAAIAVSYSIEKPKDKLVAKVIAMYLTITSREGGVATSKMFDDGGIVVDFNRAGEAIGIELLTGSPQKLAEFKAFHAASKDTMLRAASTTMAQAWPQCEVLANATLEMVRQLRTAKGLPPRESLDDLDDETGTVREFRNHLQPQFERAFVGAA